LPGAIQLAIAEREVLPLVSAFCVHQNLDVPAKFPHAPSCLSRDGAIA
jgi:hypothetical protein